MSEYRCKKCDITFGTKEAAFDHVVATGHYSPLKHVTYFHVIEGGINDDGQ
jgi:hypothetical protein